MRPSRLRDDGFQPRGAAQFDGTPSNTEPLAPRLGEHGREILTEHGYPDEEIDGLLEQGILALARDPV